MPIEFLNKLGQISVSEQVISTLVGVSVSEVYGVVGMSSMKKIKDGVVELLKKENLTKGVVIRTEDNQINVEVHIIVLYGTKISEVAQNIQEKVKFSIEQMLDMKVKEVLVIIEDVRVI